MPSQTQLVLLGISGTLWLLFCNFVASLGAAATPDNLAVIGAGCVIAALWIAAVVLVIAARDRARLLSALLMVSFLVVDSLWAILGGAALGVGRDRGLGVAANVVFVEVSIGLAVVILGLAVLRVTQRRIGAAVVAAVAFVLGLALVLLARFGAVTPILWTIADTGVSSSINAVSCPSTQLCVAVDSTGDVVTSTNPASRPPGGTPATSTVAEASTACRAPAHSSALRWMSRAT